MKILLDFNVSIQYIRNGNPIKPKVMKKLILILTPLFYTVLMASAQSSAKSIEYANQQTITFPCGETSGLTANPVTDVTATIKWKAVGGAKNYNLQYRVIGASTWITVSTTYTSYVLTELTELTRYEYRVQVVCAFGSSNYSTPSTFSTSATIACDATFGLTASPITDVSATLKWKAVSVAKSYDLQYRMMGAASWITVNTASTSYTVNDLTALTRYEFQVHVVCNNGFSSFTTSTFTTTASGTGNNNNNNVPNANAKTIATNSNVNETIINSIYPNPAYNQTTVSYTSNMENVITIKLIDITGRTISSNEYNAANGLNNYTLDLSSLNKGLYIVELTSGSNVIVKKLFVDK